MLLLSHLPSAQRPLLVVVGCVFRSDLLLHDVAQGVAVAHYRTSGKEGRIEKDEKRRRKLKAESVSLESISDSDL